ncbi:MAG: sigma-54-dependent Fis family transcriptional regulator [Desulfatiglans sp.]|jgi:DNA-binding NtrC family response regulator|nr:sigma-54-dependent Fis family transcriptional regulator [Desulfatiglans sp.]
MISDINVVLLESEHPDHAKDIEAKLNSALVRSCVSIDHNSGIDHLNSLKPDVVIIDPSLDADSSLKAIQKIKILNPVTPVLTSSEECLPAGECFAPFEGVHYLTPGAEQKILENKVDEALVYSKEHAHMPDTTFIIGKSKGIVDVRRKIRRVAEKDITVLVTGETGTGKELVARSIHFHSPRKMGPLVKVDCTSLPDELLESEIFGFQKGAFTDAYKDKPGRLEMANGGTLFVDEIGDISFSLQVKFLQVFEEKEFSRLGSTDQKVVDTRVVAATNADLWKKVQNGTFRNDLFYRLNIMQIRVPPLRERRDDIPLLIHFFLNKYCFEYKKKISDLPERVLDFLVSYNWPGNIRELENIMRRAIAVSDWSFIFQELDQSNMDTSLKPDPVNSIELDDNDSEHIRQLKLFKEQEYSLRKISKAYVSEKEHEAILDILNKTRWNRTKAAEILGVSYKTLINRMQEFGIKQ